VLNEASRIGAFLTRTAELSPIHEIIVVDGGSTDGTTTIVASRRGCRLIETRRGRGDQLNAGARAATGDVLWFVHADVGLPSNAARLVADAMSDPGLSAGAFRIRTVAEGVRGWPARWLRLADLRSRFSRSPYGDQAVFVRRTVFTRIGGFPAQPLFEDVELCRRLRRTGAIRILNARVDVSGRRFMARPFYYAIMMNVLPVLYRLGVPADTLARAYREVR
jgi:rSAM/selenodomain-associated transferase 2